MTTKELEKKAAELRIDTITAISKAGSGCLGSCMSVMEILVALYYGEMYGRKVLNFDVMRPGWEEQDYVVMSKAQASASYYALLADLGFFDKAELDFYRQGNSMLTAYPSLKIPGVTVPSGSCGQGMAMACGLAMSLKMDRKSNRVFSIIGDEELQKGLVWETAMAASYYKLNNLIVFIDNNKLQSSGNIKAIMDIDPIQDKFEAFGWQVYQVRDGHDFDKILEAVDRAFTSNRKPVCIWCHTISSKGVSFAEDKAYYHRAVPSEAEATEAISQLRKLLN